MQTIGWGFECWELGDTTLEITAGDGRDIMVHKVYGIISASSSGGPTEPTWIRQTLVTITNDVPWTSYTGTAAPAPNARSINEVNGNMASINVKQRGDQVVHVPFERTLTVPRLCKNGYIRAIIDNQTYSRTESVTSPASEAIDVEGHFWIDYQYV